MSLQHPVNDACRTNPGGAAVASLPALDGAQALSVLMYRDWFGGAEGRRRVEAVLSEALGPDRAHGALEDWDQLLEELVRHARRPLMCHHPSCQCVGADEAVFAQTLSLAAEGEREEAMLMLSLVIRADRLLVALNAAERAGRAVRWCARSLCRARAGGTPVH
ncbi:hypothetical protein [Palleronia rufa]|uniref:hypothetical protein n=1 Tax=Palleronia rufa TaxID=1530186 RepID=UPI000691599D|nr:hypothetical protein [Palleronia rufa]